MLREQRSRLAWVAAIATALLVVSVAASANAKAGPQIGPRPIKRVLVVGDSLAVGLTPNLQKLCKADGISYCASDAIVGTRIDQWSKKIQPLVDHHKPDLVFVSLGTNDAMMSNPRQNQAAMNKIIEAVRGAGARLVWIAPPSLPTTISGQRVRDDVVRAMLNESGVEQFDSTKVSVERAMDGIHATPQGYATWASAIWAYMRANP